MKDDYYLDPRVAATYDSEERGQEGDIEFYRILALEAAATGKPVLELGCGTGRVSIPIAQSGVSVVGLDSSPAMLEIARAKSGGLEDIRWVEGDMANFELDERFGLVMIPCRSFLLLVTSEAQRACLVAARQHLTHGGRLALNFFNPEIAMKARRRSEGRIDAESQAPGAVISRLYRNLRLRYVFRQEMERLLEVTGFEVEALYGGFSGEPFEDGSSEMVWVARRR